MAAESSANRRNGPPGTSLRLRLLIVAFVEGAAVMSTEFLGAKMAAPFFGTSLYAWAGVLSVTLLALAAGYFVGGYLTTRFEPRKLLAVILVIAGMALILMRFSAPAVMKAMIHLPLTTGVLLAPLTYLLPPMMCFGMVSPIIIHILTKRLELTGRTTGRVYAISTLGGVLSTILVALIVIPTYGISGPTVVSGIVVAMLSLVVLFRGLTPVGVVVIALVGLFSLQVKQDSNSRLVRVVHASEGLMGQVKVADFNFTVPSGEVYPIRSLIVNNTTQTLVNLHDGSSLLNYVAYINPILTRFDSTDNALLVGLGGGALANSIDGRGIELEVVEIDGRLEDISRKYFSLQPEVSVITDDGRHFIRAGESKYDLIILDAFLGENPPWQLLTVESFKEIQSRLAEGGVLLIEFYGFLREERGKAGRSVLKTLQRAGYRYIEMISTFGEDQIESNLVYVVSDHPIDFDSLDYSQRVYGQPILNLRDHLVDKESLDLNDAVLLTDDLPALDKMLARSAMLWRESLNPRFRDLFLTEGQPVFY